MEGEGGVEEGMDEREAGCRSEERDSIKKKVSLYPPLPLAESKLI